MPRETFEKGRKIREEVLGRERVAKSLDQADAFNRDFQEILTEYCWGACWGRGGLTHPHRSLLNLGMLAAFNRSHEFELHFRAAIGNGLSRAMLCCGVPAGVEAFRIASKVLAEPGTSLK